MCLVGERGKGRGELLRYLRIELLGEGEQRDKEGSLKTRRGVGV